VCLGWDAPGAAVAGMCGAGCVYVGWGACVWGGVRVCGVGCACVGRGRGRRLAFLGGCTSARHCGCVATGSAPLPLVSTATCCVHCSPHLGPGTHAFPLAVTIHPPAHRPTPPHLSACAQRSCPPSPRSARRRWTPLRCSGKCVRRGARGRCWWCRCCLWWATLAAAWSWTWTWRRRLALPACSSGLTKSVRKRTGGGGGGMRGGGGGAGGRGWAGRGPDVRMHRMVSGAGKGRSSGGTCRSGGVACCCGYGFPQSLRMSPRRPFALLPLFPFYPPHPASRRGPSSSKFA
jgi:hypothetical protein